MGQVGRSFFLRLLDGETLSRGVALHKYVLAFRQFDLCFLAQVELGFAHIFNRLLLDDLDRVQTDFGLLCKVFDHGNS